MGKGVCTNPQNLVANNGPGNWNNHPERRRDGKKFMKKHTLRKQQVRGGGSEGREE